MICRNHVSYQPLIQRADSVNEGSSMGCSCVFARGAADIGVVGKDVLMEQLPDLIELLDLKFGDCRLVIAGPEALKEKYLFHNIRVATSMTNQRLLIFKKVDSLCAN